MSEVKTVWEEVFQVRAFDTDFSGQMKPAAYFQAMQVAASHHAAHLGFDLETMLVRQAVWILSRVRFNFHRFPSVDEIMRVQTWPKGLAQKIFFMRDLAFVDESGEPLAEATTAWVLMHPIERRLLFPQALDGSLPITQKSAVSEMLEKIGLPLEMPAQLETSAGYSTVDLMGHVNNTRYVEWVCDALPIDSFQRGEMTWIQVNYTNEVKPGERVTLHVSQKEDQPGVWLVEGRNQSSGVRAFEAAAGFKGEAH